MAAGLHLVLGVDDEPAAVRAAATAGVGLASMGEHVMEAAREPGLILGYARIDEPALRVAAAVLAEALRRG